MTGFKYIVYKHNGLECPVLFPPFGPDHESMAYAICGSPDKVISAGFVSYDELNPVQAYGHSNSLKKHSRPEDTDLITKIFKFSM